MLTDEDARIILGQSRRLRETTSTEESRLSNPAWTDYFMMSRLTQLRHDFNKNRLRIASGADQ
jgi:hypothetical protein